jgi:fluoride exporter
LKFLWIGIGGFAGAVMRYLVSGWVQQSSKSIAFPFGTLAVNVLGCLAIGGLSYLADARGLLHADLRLLLIVGLLGGFTTFSTFGNETMNLLRDGELLIALTNVGVNVVLCLAAVWAGRAAAIAIWR